MLFSLLGDVIRRDQSAKQDIGQIDSSSVFPKHFSARTSFRMLKEEFIVT